jgi:hypothetical protein
MTTLGQTTELSAQLEELRITEDWTYLELANKIEEVTHRWRDEDCWRRICQGTTANPHGRTRDILETFLATVRARRRRVANGRRPAVRRAS